MVQLKVHQLSKPKFTHIYHKNQRFIVHLGKYTSPSKGLSGFFLLLQYFGVDFFGGGAETKTPAKFNIVVPKEWWSEWAFSF